MKADTNRQFIAINDEGKQDKERKPSFKNTVILPENVDENDLKTKEPLDVVYMNRLLH